MSQSKTKAEPTVATITEARLWDALAEGVTEISSDDEAVFEFFEDRIVVRVKDAANVTLIRQTVDAKHFEYYEVGGAFRIGLNGEKLDELLGVADPGDPVDFRYNWDNYKFEFEANGVEYDMAGVSADAVNGSPTEVPSLKDEYAFDVDVDLPVDAWERGTKVAELAGTGTGQGNFVAEDGEFLLEGVGDDDASRVRISDRDGFAWREDPPDGHVLSKQANDYMKNVVGLIDEDVVRFVVGDGLPYHVWTDRADGRIDTKFVQAPRLDKSK